jgi:hypothetical protein
MLTRHSYVRALEAAGLLDSNLNDGAFSNWMHRHIDEHLGLEEGTSKGNSRSRTRI